MVARRCQRNLTLTLSPEKLIFSPKEIFALSSLIFLKTAHGSEQPDQPTTLEKNGQKVHVIRALKNFQQRQGVQCNNAFENQFKY